MARRAYSRSELEKRLTNAGYAAEDVAATLERLGELRLIDDADFAAVWVEQRARRGLGAERLRAELENKGVAREVIDLILESSGDDELARATAIAATHLEKVIDLPLPRQASRLQGLLARRGFSEEVVDSAVRAVLPPEGWD